VSPGTLKPMVLHLGSSRTLPIEDLCKTQTLHTSLEDYRLAVGAGSRNRDAAFELALKSTTPFSVGDRYYITAGKGPSYGRARLASDLTHSCAMKTLDTISSNSKMWPNSLTSSLPAARGRADSYKPQQGQDCLSPCRALPNQKVGLQIRAF
jgi:hypothetical protein